VHLAFPFAGSRMLRDLLRQEGVKVGRLHVATLMKKMAIAPYPPPDSPKQQLMVNLADSASFPC
jgi:putative transposase